MDILAARKKAAEQALARKKAGQEAEPTVAREQPACFDPKKRVEPPSLPDPQPAADMTDDPAVPEKPIGAPSQAAAGIGPDVPKEPSVVEQQSLETSEAPVPDLEMLSFRLGQEEYALAVEDVKEVLKNREFTGVPNAPDHILGVTSVRGCILPVIDLCRLIGMPAAERDEKSRILIVDLDGETIGVVVDRVTGVVRINPDAVKPAPENGERGSEFLKGIARKDDKLYILLDIEKALGA